MNPGAHPSLSVGEISISLPRGGIALRYADNFGPVSSSPFGDEPAESGIILMIQPVYSGMDTRGWVLKAIESLRFASEKDIVRWLDEEGESLSKDELQRTLERLLKEGQLELKNDLFRLKRKDGSHQAFDNLFKD